MRSFREKVVDNAVISIASAFIAGIITSSLAALFSGAVLPLWRMYPAEFRSESVMWSLVGLVGGIIASWLYASQKSLSAAVSFGSWGAVLVGLFVFSTNQDNRNFFPTPQIEYAVFCALLTMLCILLLKTAFILLRPASHRS